ncbi:SRPBCC family protein [Granulicella mallensis]|uniref:Polyketide cyclase/dehydrase n=1 Tax=Granulicella mallensis (strain ATCC BAA-1857 / DSM 23137 / MP5ACTX8) TaxID=682795 RepID=G8NU93_GRAMM|nr:SRPBCC family protein [Granulicella mallensis]AEU38728.1 Polyketide cyclase/dehydrase [Granulicella mallensis MP5ACTX8]
MDESTEPAEPSKLPKSTREISNAQWMLAAFLVVAFGLGAVLYKFTIHVGLGHTSAIFIGIPAILALVLALAPRAKTVTGGILRGITIALLVVAPLLGEGYLCILFSAPLFYLVGLGVGSLVDYYRKSRSTTLSCIAILLLPMSLEGVVPQLTHNRAQSVTATQIVDAPASAVEAALAQSPHIDTALPHFLRIGFPRPLEAHGEGLDLGATRTIHFAGAEGDPPGDLVMQVTDRHPGHVRFTTISDSSKLTQWVRWQTSEVTWTPLDATHTSVTWSIAFDRQLDPYWYFAPWEQVAIREAAKYLITANATPTGTAR